jgi:hypothetical protein
MCRLDSVGAVLVVLSREALDIEMDLCPQARHILAATGRVFMLDGLECNSVFNLRPRTIAGLPVPEIDSWNFVRT